MKYKVGDWVRFWTMKEWGGDPKTSKEKDMPWGEVGQVIEAHPPTELEHGPWMATISYTVVFSEMTKRVGEATLFRSNKRVVISGNEYRERLKYWEEL